MHNPFLRAFLNPVMIIQSRRGDLKEVSLCRTRACGKLNSLAILENCSLEAVTQDFNEGEIFLSVKDDKILGTISLVKNQITGLYVDPAFSGKGVGKELLNFIEKYALKKGFKELYLFSIFGSEKFYLKNGFKPDGIFISYEFKVPSQFVRMKKKL